MKFKDHVLAFERLFYGISLTDFRKLGFEYSEANKIFITSIKVRE